MCGFLTIVSRHGLFSRPKVKAALATLTHRGPDGYGLECTQLGGWDVWMGHTRLAIVDLSAQGRQPFHIDGEHSAAIVFNGEIYNHRHLRQTISQPFTSQTDTEVLLRGLVEYGERFLTEANGMFAFALLDSNQKTLMLGRDRLGKKPLYFLQTPDLLVCASELKAFVELGLDLTLDESALASFHWLGYVLGPATIYKEVQKFPSASFGLVQLGQDSIKVETSRFWDPLASFGRTYSGTYDEACDELEFLIEDAVRLRLDADVPVGVFLSGGIDSSLVVAVASRLKNDVEALTIELQDPRLDESGFALDTGRQLGIQVTKLKVDLDFDDQDLVWHYDEPFADISQIPTMAISRVARQHVKCVLTGDGGDELFLGYPWMTYPERIVRARRLIPSGVRSLLSALIDSPFGHECVQQLSQAYGMNPSTTSSKVKLLRDCLNLPQAEQLYDLFKNQQHREFVSHDLRNILPVSLAEHARGANHNLAWDALEGRNLAEYLGAVDLLTFLRDDVLVKVDRGTMAFGLEARSPLLDYRIVEFAHSLPFHFKVQGGTYKRILRDLLGRRIRGAVLNRGKQGFGIPVPKDVPNAATPSAAWRRRVERVWFERWMPERGGKCD